MIRARFVGIISIILVTTYVNLTNGLLKELPVVRHECGEKTLCHIKPADYPQDEIDRLAFKYLRHLQRTKRQVVLPAKPERGGNCETETLNATIYTIRDTNKVPKYIVQSRYHSQYVPQVQCKDEGSPCFSAFVIPGLVGNIKCKTTQTTVSLTTYNPDTKKLETENSLINSDCTCEIEL